MQASINNTLIKSIKPAEKPFEVRDTALKGLILRVQPSGSKTYYVEYARGKRVKIGRADALTPVQAREQAKIVLSDAFRGEEPEAAKRRRKAYTLKEFLDEVYLPWARINIRTAKDTESRLKNSFSSLMDIKITDLSLWHIEKWKSERLKKQVKKSSINREFNDLRACLNKAVAQGVLAEYPLKGFQRFKEDQNEEPRFLSTAEEKRLREELDTREGRIRQARENGNEWRHERGYELKPEFLNQPFTDHLKPMVLVSINTGIRQGELFSLEWKDVDLKLGNMTIRGNKAKSGTTRHVPLNDEALRTLKDWQRQTQRKEGLIFQNKEGKRFDNVRKAWEKVLKNAKIKDFRWHDLRHHFASRLVQAGVNLNTVRELLGHSDYKMTLRYSHINEITRISAVQRLNSEALNG